MTLMWDYDQGHVDVSMSGYIARALTRFRVQLPTRPQYSPHACSTIQYSIKTQLTEPLDTTNPLDTAGIHTVKELFCVILYYARAINSTILITLNTIGSKQATVTQNITASVTQLLHYIGTHPDATVRFHASDMVLHIHSDASYLS